MPKSPAPQLRPRPFSQRTMRVKFVVWRLPGVGQHGFRKREFKGLQLHGFAHQQALRDLAEQATRRSSFSYRVFPRAVDPVRS